jgi:hypothetical protein
MGVGGSGNSGLETMSFAWGSLLRGIPPYVFFESAQVVDFAVVVGLQKTEVRKLLRMLGLWGGGVRMCVCLGEGGGVRRDEKRAT